MKKKILTLLFSLILCLCIVTPAFAAQTDGFASEYERVQDLAGLLSGNEESLLVTKLNELSERQKMDIVVLTTDTLDGKTPRDYADDIYDYGNFGYGESKDGALLLISIEDNDWYISTCGYGITVFTDAGIEYIGKQIKGDLSDGNFAGAFDKFADLCDDFITQARTGEPYDVKNLPKEPLSLIWIPIAIVVGFVLSLIIVGNMKAKLKTVRFQAAASNYIKDNSLNINERRDLFLYNTVTRTAKQKVWRRHLRRRSSTTVTGFFLRWTEPASACWKKKRGKCFRRHRKKRATAGFWNWTGKRITPRNSATTERFICSAAAIWPRNSFRCCIIWISAVSYSMTGRNMWTKHCSRMPGRPCWWILRNWTRFFRSGKMIIS